MRHGDWLSEWDRQDLGNVSSSVLLGDDCGPAGGPDCENIQFFGVTNTDVSSSVQLALSIPTGSGTVYFDRLEFSTIPEPFTALLLALGLAGLAVQGRRTAARFH
jgi:hypothetical protein